jgi:hypothetical protein
MKAESDDALAAEVADNIRRYVFYTVYDDVEGRVRDGVVTLTGRVTAPYRPRSSPISRHGVHGVQQVDNQIQTSPVSTFDDQLRATNRESHLSRPAVLEHSHPAQSPTCHHRRERSRQAHRHGEFRGRTAQGREYRADIVSRVRLEPAVRTIRLYAPKEP